MSFAIHGSRHGFTEGFGMGSSDGSAIPVIGSVSTGNMNTTVTNSMGPDGITWANCGPAVIDQYGNVIVITEDNAGLHWFSYLNASGSTWADGAVNENFLIRGAMWLDQAHGYIHVLWVATQANGGVIYRRYVITYSGSNITAIASDSTIGTRTNVVLDDGTGMSSYEHPNLLPLPDIGGTYGALVASWSALSATGTEIRSAMLVMGANATAGQTLANWVFPVVSDTTGLGANTAPAVGSYSKLYSSANHTDHLYHGLMRHAVGSHANDLFLVHTNGLGSAAATYSWRRATWNAPSSKWSSGLTTDTTICAVQRSGTDTGYNLKIQLIGQPSEDGNGTMYTGLAYWNGNALGDTWGVARVDASGTLTIADLHNWNGVSQGGTPSLYPTGDVCVDPATGYLIATWITQTQAIAQVFDRNSLTSSGGTLVIFNAVFDIPLITRFRVGSPATKTGFFGRDAINTPTPPYHGRWATVQWS